MSHPSLEEKVEAIERDLRDTVRAAARENVWVTHYGAFEIHPRHLVYWLCVKSDAEKQRLQAHRILMEQLREILVRYDYPPEGRDSVHIGFESQETVDRESDGNWWYHWK
jgi:hypothetical protein